MPEDVVIGAGEPGADVAADVTTPEGDSGSEDLEQIAAEFEQEALAEFEAGADKGEGKEGEGGKGRLPTTPDALDEFIQRNYQGDRAAFVASLHESRQEARRLADEVAVLKSKIAPPTPPRDVIAEIKTRLDQDPEVQSLHQEARTIDAENQQIQQRQLALANEASARSSEIAKLEGQLVNANEENRAQLYADLMTARARLSGISIEFEANDRAQKQSARYRSGLERRYAQIQKEISASLEREDSEKRQDEEVGEMARQEFATTFEAEARAYGLKAGSEQYNILRESIRMKLAEYLESQGRNGRGIDIPQSVSQLMKRAAAAFGFNKSTARPRIPQTQRPIVTPRTPQRIPAPASESSASRSPVDEMQNSPDYWRRRADRIYGSLGKRK